MEDFRRQFLLEAADKLESISKNLRRGAPLSESFKRETFRTLHTIKGTAQTFGFSTASRLAHALETMLAESETSAEIFLEGVEILGQSLQSEDFDIPKNFLEKIGVENSQTDDSSDILTEEMPAPILTQLSNQEKSALRAARRNQQNLFCLEIGFELANFADELIKFRQILSADGEIIATLPSAKYSRDGQIGFQILYAASPENADVASIARDNAAEIIFSSTKDYASNNLLRAATYAVRHGKEIAEKSGKRIDFELVVEETEISVEKSKIVFDVLLHLVRNAVDHAVLSDGKIRIYLETKDENLHLKVSDDGEGIDLTAVKAKAIEKKLISAGDDLTEKQLISFIFQPEFTTKSVITEVSGRGVGLDAVKTLIEKSGGAINAGTENGRGTTFEIILPLGQN